MNDVQFPNRTISSNACLLTYSSHICLCNSMNCSPQGPLSMGFSRQEGWSGLPVFFSRGSSQPGYWTQVSLIAGRSLGVGNGNPLQYSCLENSMCRETGGLQSLGVTKSWTWLSDWTCTHNNRDISSSEQEDITKLSVVPLIQMCSNMKQNL